MWRSIKNDNEVQSDIDRLSENKNAMNFGQKYQLSVFQKKRQLKLPKAKTLQSILKNHIFLMNKKVRSS